MLGSSVIGGWRIGWANWPRHEGVYAAACVFARDDLTVFFDPDELPVRIWIAGIGSHVLLCSVRRTPALAASGPEKSVCGLDVFGCLKRIVAVGSEILSQVDRELGDRVAVVFDTFSECVV